MSRPQPIRGHRKSQSTSALAVMAASTSSAGHSTARTREERMTPRLGRVEESESDAEPMSGKQGRRKEGHERTDNGMAMPGAVERRATAELMTLADLKARITEILSLRASAQRRLAALEHIEKSIVTACIGPRTTSDAVLDLREILDLDLHSSLLNLLTRHFQSLSTRSEGHSALPAHDNLAIALVPEMVIILGLLQGLCLMSARSKASCGEEWALEMFIDLLLLVRAIPAASSDPASRPLVYSILELLFCILVDSPDHARMFEKLSGLEAVTRVLKGSSVSKEVRMKCIEFLYFYLLPEHKARSASSSSSGDCQRATSSSSTASTSSSDSAPHPPSPLDVSDPLPPAHRLSPVPPSQHSAAVHEGPKSPRRRPDDLDIHFVPQTPSKKVTPLLGYLTPSSRRVSNAPNLESVPASPMAVSRDPSLRDPDPEVTPKSDRRGSKDASAPRRRESNAKAGLGLGLPGSPEKGGRILEGGIVIPRDVTAVHLASLATAPSPSITASPPVPPLKPFTPSSSTLTPPVPSTPSPHLSGILADQTSPASMPSSNSGASRGMARSSTQPALANLPISGSSRSSHRHVSARRPSKSPLAQSSIPESPEAGAAEARKQKHRHSTPVSQLMAKDESREAPPLPPLPRIKHSRTSSRLDEILPPESSAIVAPQLKMRQSHTSSQLASILASPRAAPVSAAPMNASKIRHSRTQSHMPFLTPSTEARADSLSVSASQAGLDMQRTPSKQRRAFPAELTRGSLPVVYDSPKPTPLGSSRRIPSSGHATSSSADQRQSSGRSGENTPVKQPTKEGVIQGLPATKTVDEKKELLGKWLGNVDQLVSGVERTSWWAGATKR